MVKIIPTIKFLFIGLVFLQSAAADFSSAVKNYNDKNYQQAFKQFHELAKLGSQKSQLNLGLLYFNGFGVEKDINKAYAWSRIGNENEISNDRKNPIFRGIDKAVIDKQTAVLEYQKLIEKYSFKFLKKTIYPEYGYYPEMIRRVQSKSNYSILPEYPYKLRKQEITGWVTLQFDVDAKGKPRNIVAVESIPKSVFDKTAFEVFPQWEFEIKYNSQDEAIWNLNQEYTLFYGLEDIPSLNIDYYLKVKKAAVQGNHYAEYRFGMINIRQGGRLKKIGQIFENPNVWFLKSAINGLSDAQLEIAKCILYGKYCSNNIFKGIYWLKLSAVNGNIVAKELFAKLSLQRPEMYSQKLALQFLQSTLKLSPMAAVQFAKLLTSSQNIALRDPDKAIELVDSLASGEYWDEVTLLEIEAAANASLGKFTKAIKKQQKALDLAVERNIDVIAIQKNLAEYKQQMISL